MRRNWSPHTFLMGMSVVQPLWKTLWHLLLKQSVGLPCVCAQLGAQLYPILCGPMDCKPPGSSVHGFSRKKKIPMAPTSPELSGRFFPSKPPGKPCGITVEPHNCTLVHLFQKIENYYRDESICA